MIYNKYGESCMFYDIYGTLKILYMPHKFGDDKNKTRNKLFGISHEIVTYLYH